MKTVYNSVQLIISMICISKSVVVERLLKTNFSELEVFLHLKFRHQIDRLKVAIKKKILTKSIAVY